MIITLSVHCSHPRLQWIVRLAIIHYCGIDVMLTATTLKVRKRNKSENRWSNIGTVNKTCRSPHCVGGI